MLMKYPVPQRLARLPFYASTADSVIKQHLEALDGAEHPMHQGGDLPLGALGGLTLSLMLRGEARSMQDVETFLRAMASRAFLFAGGVENPVTATQHEERTSLITVLPQDDHVLPQYTTLVSYNGDPAGTVRGVPYSVNFDRLEYSGLRYDALAGSR